MILKEYRVDEQKGLKGQSNCGMPNAECGINQAKLRTPNYELRTSAIHSPQSMGMTLIEIIMVMVIIGILSVFLIPKFNLDYSSEAALNGAAYLIASDIRYAQEFAMANRVSKTVTFSTNPPGPTVYTFTPTNSFDPSGQLPSGVTIISNFTITFNSLGEPTTGGDGSVTILGGGLTKTVSVVNYTGKVNIL